MFCYKCGKELHDESKFCAYCGERTPVGLTKEKPQEKTPSTQFDASDTSRPINANSFVKEIVNYFIGLGLYILGITGCFSNYKKMISFQGILSDLFDIGNDYGLLLIVAFICTIIGIFLMLGNMVEAKLVFDGASVVAILACILFGAFFIWVLTSLGIFIEAGIY